MAYPYPYGQQPSTQPQRPLGQQPSYATGYGQSQPQAPAQPTPQPQAGGWPAHTAAYGPNTASPTIAAQYQGSVPWYYQYANVPGMQHQAPQAPAGQQHPAQAYTQQPQRPQANPAPQSQPQQPAPRHAEQGGQQLIGTSIQPQGVYPQSYTQQAGNVAAAGYAPAWNDLVSGRQLDGVSVNSPMTQYGMGADLASMLAAAQTAPAALQLQHGLANSQSMLGGQVARDQEALGWGQLGLGNYGNVLQNQLSQQGALLDFLRQIYGGLF